MKKWKQAANLLWLEIGKPDSLDLSNYPPFTFEQWMQAANEFLVTRTNYEKCDTLRKQAIASILDQFKQGKTLVHSEQAYIQNGDSGWDWVGRVTSSAGDDIDEHNLSFHTYDTFGDDPDEECEGKDIWSHVDDISTDCLCAVADNLYA